jgi:hypothetical protein
MKSLIENLSKSKVVQNCVVEINFVVIILYVRSGMNEFLNLKYYTFLKCFSIFRMLRYSTRYHKEYMYVM